MNERPPLYAMVKEAVVRLGGKAPSADIRKYLWSAYEDVNESSVSAHIGPCMVNSPSSIHFPQNQRPGLATDPRYDFLYSTGRGQVELYDPEVHGTWEIRKDEFGKPVIGLVGAVAELRELDAAPLAEEPNEASNSAAYYFPLQSHLRDFIARNIGTIKIGGGACTCTLMSMTTVWSIPRRSVRSTSSRWTPRGTSSCSS